MLSIPNSLNRFWDIVDLIYVSILRIAENYLSQVYELTVNVIAT
jgi:hypothetical protein